MALRTVVQRVFGATGPSVVRECGRCGTTVEAGTDECPACASGDIHRYEID